MTLLFQATCILTIILACASSGLAVLNPKYQWKYIDYVWETEAYTKARGNKGAYDYEKIIPFDVQPLPDGRILVTTPRYSDNPASLSVISDKTGPGGPLLQPYPSWNAHNTGTCDDIISVTRLFLDDYNRLWFVDSGKIGNQQVCAAKIYAFDVRNDRLVVEVEIPHSLTWGASEGVSGYLEIGAVEVSEESRHKFWVYIADIIGDGLIIWDGSDIWRIETEAFPPQPNATEFVMGENKFNLEIGPSCILLSPKGYLKNPVLFLHPMAGVKGYALTLKDLHNSKYGGKVDLYRSSFTAPNQELARDYSKQGGIMIASFIAGAVACWNIQDPLKLENIAFVDTNATNLRFISGIKITRDPKTEVQTVWASSVSMDNFILGNTDWNAINYRILTSDLAELIKGTVCEPREVQEISESINDKEVLYYKTVNGALIARFPTRTQ